MPFLGSKEGAKMAARVLLSLAHQSWIHICDDSEHQNDLPNPRLGLSDDSKANPTRSNLASSMTIESI